MSIRKKTVRRSIFQQPARAGYWSESRSEGPSAARLNSESRYTQQRELAEQPESSDRPWNRLFLLAPCGKVCQFGAQRIYSPAFARLTNNDGLTPNALAIERSDSPFAWRLRTTSMSMSARFGPGTLPALRARSRPAFVRSEMLMRSAPRGSP